MIQPLLSIQLPYTKEREDNLEKLIKEFFRQKSFYDPFLINIESDGRGKEISIGEKRHDLYQKTEGKYVVQWDSDDDIHPQGLKMIIEALQNNPDVDCVTYEEYVNIDGKEYKSNHSNEYSDWEGDGNILFPDGFHFHRTPFFKSVIRTKLAKSVPIPYIRFGEDHQWAQALKPYIKSEIHIPEQLYRYIHISSPHNERYGFDK